MPQTNLGTETDMALNLVDLARYPIADLETGKGAEFLKECQDHMDAHGWCNLDGFIRVDALAALEEESNNLLPSAECRGADNQTQHLSRRD